jgi:hypothetical protein
MVPVRLVAERFAATLNASAPLPVLLAVVSVIQLEAVVAVQAQPVNVVTVALVPVTAVPASVSVVGDRL